MALDFPVIRRQRKLGAFPTADQARAEKLRASLPPPETASPNVPPVVETPVVKSAAPASKKKSNDDPTNN